MPKNSSNNKDIVMATALGLFTEKGFDNVSVKDICEAANIPRSSFYLLFSDKADIMTYLLQSVKENFYQEMPDFIRAENDFERIWFLTNSYVKYAELFGPEIIKQYFIMEIKGVTQFFRIIEDFTDWLIQLLANCQHQGIVRNMTDPSILLPMQYGLAKAHLLDWVCSNGAFPLHDTVRCTLENFLDVAPEYRKT